MSKVAPEGSTDKSNDDKKPKKALRSPLKVYLDYKAKLKLEEDARLWKREEVMKEDLERFLMELEERLSWVAYELEVTSVKYISILLFGFINRFPGLLAFSFCLFDGSFEGSGIQAFCPSREGEEDKTG